ncbi:hypothetical protein [Metasolibacillus meyeri]|nr:hypothetical protein [Metasolibacillus meyeri]
MQHVEDRYTLYVLLANIDAETFWNAPVATVERIYDNKLAFDGWRNAEV